MPYTHSSDAYINFFNYYYFIVFRVCRVACSCQTNIFCATNFMNWWAAFVHTFVFFSFFISIQLFDFLSTLAPPPQHIYTLFTPPWSVSVACIMYINTYYIYLLVSFPSCTARSVCCQLFVSSRAFAYFECIRNKYKLWIVITVVCDAINVIHLFACLRACLFAWLFPFPSVCAASCRQTHPKRVVRASDREKDQAHTDDDDDDDGNGAGWTK